MHRRPPRSLLTEWGPERLRKRLIKVRLLAVDANLYTRLKLLVGFYQVADCASTHARMHARTHAHALTD